MLTPDMSKMETEGIEGARAELIGARVKKAK
jgi:hypothetical protein